MWVWILSALLAGAVVLITGVYFTIARLRAPGGRTGRIEGVLLIDGKPAPADTPVACHLSKDYEKMPRWLAFFVGRFVDIDLDDGSAGEFSRSSILWTEYTMTDAEGRFTFRRVPAGDAGLGRAYGNALRKSWLFGFVTAVDDQEVHSDTERRVAVRVGETTQVTLGTGGVRLQGRFVAPGGNAVIQGIIANCAFLSSVREDRNIPDEIPPGERDAWWKAFVNPEEGQEWLDDLHRMHHVAVEGDGSFTAFNVHPGRYELKAQLDRAPEEAGLPNRIFGEYTGIVEVPPVDADTPPVLDLGELPLRVYATLSPGDPMPDVAVRRHDGQPVNWAAYRGRYLLLCLWWPLDDIEGEFPKALNGIAHYRTGRKDLNFHTLIMDGQWAAAKYRLQHHKPAWSVNYLLEEDSPAFAAAFGVRNSSLFLFAPDGTLAAGGIAPRDLEGCLRPFLELVA